MTKTKTKTNRRTKTSRPVLVTTEHRGVFFGYTTAKGDAAVVTLEKARFCLYWSAPTKSVFGLATRGPQEGSRVSSAVQKLTLQAVTAIAECSLEAVRAWEAEPWR